MNPADTIMAPSAPFFTLRVSLLGLTVAGGAVVATATVLGFFGARAWYLDLFSHFRVQYFLALAAAALVLAALRWLKTATAFGLLALVNLAVLAPLYFGRTPMPAGTHPPPLRVMLLNVNTHNGNPPRVSAAILQAQPDIAVIQEVSAHWVAAMDDVISRYPHRHIEPREDNFGIALFSRFPFRHCRTVEIGPAGVPSIVAEVATPQGPCTVVATHPLPPGGREYSRLRNEQLAALAAFVRQTAPPLLLVGDLNTTPWSPHFTRLLRDSGLRDSARGWGVQPTWPDFNPLLRIPIDHLLHAPGISIVKRRVGPPAGSDHFPLIVDVLLPATPAGVAAHP